MILSSQEITRIASETAGTDKPFIKGFTAAHVNPSSYDVTIGGHVKYYRNGSYVGHEYAAGDVIVLEPYAFMLAHTVETFSIPEDLCGFYCGKSNTARNGVSTEIAGLCDGGFAGQITLEVYNQTDSTKRIPVGERVGQVYFMPIMNPGPGYSPKNGAHFHGQTGPTEPHRMF